MVLEQFMYKRIVTSHFYFVFVLSILYVFVAYGVQTFFFPDQSLATVLLSTLLILPSLHHLIVVEEQIERSGSAHFFAKHRTILRCYIGAFFGLLAGFLILGQIDSGALNYQQFQLQTEHLKPELISNFTKTYSPNVETAIALFSHNVQYLLLGLLISIFYGAGALFLIVYNASFFAAFVLQLSARFASAWQLTFVSLLHLIPESSGYILTAIAGATMSRAIMKEKLGGTEFRNVSRNCFLLLMLAIICILVAAFVETYVTAVVFQRLV